MRSRVQVSLSLQKKIRSGFATPFFCSGERRVCYPPPKSPSCEGDLYFRYINPFCKLYYPFVILQEWVRNFDTLSYQGTSDFIRGAFFLIPTQSNARARLNGLGVMGLMGRRWVEDGIGYCADKSAPLNAFPICSPQGRVQNNEQEVTAYLYSFYEIGAEDGIGYYADKSASLNAFPICSPQGHVQNNEQEVTA